MFGNLGLFLSKYEYYYSRYSVDVSKAALGMIVTAPSYSMVCYLPLLPPVLDKD